MSANSKIEWTDHTFNPWIGCTKVSPGCVNCYAEARDRRHLIEPVDHWGKGAPRLRTSASNWKQPLKWNAVRFGICARCGPKDDSTNEGRCPNCTRVDLWWPRRARVFCASLADIFDDEVPIEWLADFLDLVYRCQNLDFQILTKRPENFFPRLNAALHYALRCNPKGLRFSGWLSAWTDGEAPENVWIGTSVEDQKRADERIPELLATPAAVRFLSCEPLLGPVELGPGVSMMDWIIAGGESGPNARPMHPDWARSLRDQCQAAAVPFFFKQWGEWRAFRKGDDPNQASALTDLGTNKLCSFIRPGKRATGRELDGVDWSQFPSPSSILHPQSSLAAP